MNTCIWLLALRDLSPVIPDCFVLTSHEPTSKWPEGRVSYAIKKIVLAIVDRPRTSGSTSIWTPEHFGACLTLCVRANSRPLLQRAHLGRVGLDGHQVSNAGWMGRKVCDSGRIARKQKHHENSVMLMFFNLSVCSGRDRRAHEIVFNAEPFCI